MRIVPKFERKSRGRDPEECGIGLWEHPSNSWSAEGTVCSVKTSESDGVKRSSNLKSLSAEMIIYCEVL